MNFSYCILETNNNLLISDSISAPIKSARYNNLNQDS